MIIYEWRGTFGNGEVAALHAEGFAHAPGQRDWWKQVREHSLGWVCARDAGAIAADNARKAGCDWLHVDFGPRLAPFYLDGCGFQETAGGLIALR